LTDTLASMKRKNNFATWWRYISDRKCYVYTLITKMAPPGGEIKFLFHTNNAKLPSLSHAKKHFLKLEKKTFSGDCFI